MPASSSSSSFTPLTFLQYAVFAAVAYVLAGAPFLSSILSGTSLGAGEVKKEKQYSYEKIESLMTPDPELVCEEQGYKVHVFSREPLVIYLEGFLSEEERRHVVDIRYVFGLMLGVVLWRRPRVWSRVPPSKVIGCLSGPCFSFSDYIRDEGFLLDLSPLLFPYANKYLVFSVCTPPIYNPNLTNSTLQHPQLHSLQHLDQQRRNH
jgi:hypothetical protein